MKKLTFAEQIRLGIGGLVLCFILGTVTKQGLFHNLGWIFYGILFVVNPVWPKSWDYGDHDRLRLGGRIAGALAIVVGLITRFGV